MLPVRLVQSVLLASPAGRVQELQRLDREVRRPLPLSTRVGVVGVAGGVGCSTVAGLAASVLAARRPYRVLAVNASGSRRSLLWHVGTTAPATSTADGEAQRRAARTSEGAVAGLPGGSGRPYCLDLQTDGAVPDARWWQAVAPGGRFFDFVVTDWGVRVPSSMATVVSASTVVCVVAAADRTSLQRGVDLAHGAAESGARVVLAVVDIRGRRPAAIGDAVRLLPTPAVELPHDRAHGAVRPVPSRELRPATTLATLRLAAALVRLGAAGRVPVPGVGGAA